MVYEHLYKARHVADFVYRAILHGAAFVLVVLGVPQDSRAVERTELPTGIFAVIEGEEIARADFDAYLAQYLRSNLYHGGSKARLAELTAEAEERFILERLLVREADRRGMSGDQGAVDARIASLQDEYEDTKSWATVRNELPKIRQQLLNNSKIETLEQEVRAIAEPAEDELRAYYEENLDLFTQPPQNRLSIILLGVHPGASSAEWDDAQNKADELHRAIVEGADFAAFAREHSVHDSADKGGDIGLLHAGELSQASQMAVDKLAIGETAPPVRVLEGFVLFKLVERHGARVQPFDVVRSRALSLYMRNKSQAKWDRFVSGLMKNANVTIDAGEDVAKPTDARPPD